MGQDLLVLTLLKVPVTIIRYLSSFMAILTYLPNYIFILAMDSIIFSATLARSAPAYLLSWPLRVLSMAAVLLVFGAELYCLYQFLGVQGLFWGWQLLLLLLASQIILALMRHGYLSMISKFDPVKLKSPLEHIIQIFDFIVDLMALLLCLVNLLLIIKASDTFKHHYREPAQATRLAKDRSHNNEVGHHNQGGPIEQNQPRYPYLLHLLQCIRGSVLAYLHLFYIRIFFRLFPWRYEQEIGSVRKEAENILNLTVLLTLLWLGTLLDLAFLSLFGLYCYHLHPRKQLYRQALTRQHKKYLTTIWFLSNSSLEIGQLLVLALCLPLRWGAATKAIRIITGPNDYTRHYCQEVVLAVKLALIKIPSLFCLSFLLGSIYKYRRMNLLLKECQQEEVQKSELQKLLERDRIIFKCFGQLAGELPFWLLVAPNTLMKPWNSLWLRHCIGLRYKLNLDLVLGYFIKNVTDYCLFVPCLLLVALRTLYDPWAVYADTQACIHSRNSQRSRPGLSDPTNPFFTLQFSSVKWLFSQTCQQIGKDVFFIPLFILIRISLLAALGCPHPSSSVELVESLMMDFYQRRVRKSGKYEEFEGLLKADEGAGFIKTRRDRLQFWKFAHKSCRHSLMARIMGKLLPRRRVERIKGKVRPVKGYSSISNHYWQQNQISWALLTGLLFFIIEIVFTIFGVVVLVPLTLWRLPTFAILFRAHKYSRRMFFPIIGKIYVQMLTDVLMAPLRLLCLILFPRASCDFYRLSAFQYGHEGIVSFQKAQQLKESYFRRQVLCGNVLNFWQVLKVALIKLLWVRKRDFNKELTQARLLLRNVVKGHLLDRQVHPTLQVLLHLNDELAVPSFRTPTDALIDKYFEAAMEDVPYLFLAAFLLGTLPWRFFYIKKCLLLLRDHRRNRVEFHRLVRKISKDYLCILLYIALFASGVKIKRAMQLLHRNFKLNFQISFLKYSHLQELQQELLEAGLFYRSIPILLASLLFAPYRARQTASKTFRLYRDHRQAQIEKLKLQQIHLNTLKEGKELQVLTNVGYQSLICICDYLEPVELLRMTGVCTYLYEGVRDSEEIWEKQWKRLFAASYPNLVIRKEAGTYSYDEMCVKACKQSMKENTNKKKGSPQTLHELSIQQFNHSAFDTHIDVKVLLQKWLTHPQFNSLFNRTLLYQIDQGFGPEPFWPQPQDNEEYLALMNIERRPYNPSLSEFYAYYYWLLLIPVEFLIIRCNGFYNRDTWRRVKQLFFIASTFLSAPAVLIMSTWHCWSWFWTIDSLIGCKLVGLVCCVAVLYLFIYRYERESRQWVCLHPFNLTQDFVDAVNSAKEYLGRKALSLGALLRRTGRLIKVRIIEPIMKPIRWVGRKLVQIKTIIVEKVAVPLYQSIARKLVVLWKLAVSLWKFSLKTLLECYNFVTLALRRGGELIVMLAQNISSLYQKLLEKSLGFALGFGILGELIFTIITITMMVSPSLICYLWCQERWFVIMSTILSMGLLSTGYKHLSKVKGIKSSGVGAQKKD